MGEKLICTAPSLPSHSSLCSGLTGAANGPTVVLESFQMLARTSKVFLLETWIGLKAGAEISAAA
jgi:hypothetical protein